MEFRHECFGDVEVIESDMVSAAGSSLGFEGRKQPDWFKVSSVYISELIKKHNALFAKWLVLPIVTVRGMLCSIGLLQVQ